MLHSMINIAYVIKSKHYSLDHLFCFLPVCADVQTFWQSISHQMFSAHAGVLKLLQFEGR